jgi:hypothetical protein
MQCYIEGHSIRRDIAASRKPLSMRKYDHGHLYWGDIRKDPHLASTLLPLWASICQALGGPRISLRGRCVHERFVRQAQPGTRNQMKLNAARCACGWA